MKNEKGYILISSLLLFMLVMLISITLINICITNYEIQDIYVKSKEAFYKSEGGLDTVYSEVAKYVEFSIERSNKKVEDFLKNEYDEFLKEEKSKEMQGIDSEYIDLIEDEFGIHFVINKEKIDEKLNVIFKKEYEKCFLRMDRNYILKRNLKNLNLENIKCSMLNADFDDKKELFFEVEVYFSNDKMTNELGQRYYIDVPNKDDIYNENNIGELIHIKKWIRKDRRD